MNNNDVIKAAHCCISRDCGSDCPFADCEIACSVAFARFISENANNLNEESSKISDSPEFSEINGLLVLEHFKNIVKALGGKIKSVYADKSEARLEYELGDCGYFLSFGGN